MSIKELLNQYINQEITALEVIRTLSGAFNPQHAVDLLAIIQQVVRHEQKDLDTETFKSMFKLE